MRRKHHLQVGASLQILDPLVGLALRVDHERPASSIGHHYGIVNGQGVIWQACQQPFPHFHRLAQDGIEGEGCCVSNVQPATQRDEAGSDPLPTNMSSNGVVTLRRLQCKPPGPQPAMKAIKEPLERRL